jgi:uncharacterized membrane protein
LPKRRSWPLGFFLVLSLTLNLFAIGGFAVSRWVMHHGPDMTPGHRLELLVHKLELTQDQKAAFDNFVSTVRTAQMDLFDQNKPAFSDAWTELDKPEPDAAQITQLLAQMGHNREQFQTRITPALIQFVKTLTPDQRARLREMVLDPHEPGGAVMRRPLSD